MKVRKGRAALLLLAAGLLVVTAIAVNQGADPWSGPIPAAPSEPDDPAGRLPVTFTVSARGLARRDGLVAGGVPLARGQVQRDLALRVRAGKALVPVRLRALAWWPDGSVRWVHVAFRVTLAADETRTFTLEPGTGPALPTPTLALPELNLSLISDRGEAVVRLVTRSGKPWTWSDRATGVSLEVEAEPRTPGRARVRLHVRQREGNARWRALSVQVTTPGDVTTGHRPGAMRRGTWSVAVRRAAERGPKTVSSLGDVVVVGLYPESAQAFPADEGFGVHHELFLERSTAPDDLAARIDAPLRFAWPPKYVHATRAMGRTGTSPAKDAAFHAGWEALRAQQAKPRNRGWVAWGDVFDREHSLAYAGYLNHEYDPATALFLRHARTGDPEALDAALDMANHFADACVARTGGTYQHRSTLFALERQVASAIAAALIARWRSVEGTPADDAAIVAFVKQGHGPKAARKAKGILQKLAEEQPARREQQASQRLAYGLVDTIRKKLEQDPAVRTRFKDRRPTLKDYAQGLLADKTVQQLEVPGLDVLFAAFFARYGGGWDDFPAFHFLDLPLERKAHSGGHALVEMLVWGHLWTGDPALRRAALRVAGYHVRRLIPREIAAVEAQLAGDQPIFLRNVGWPLINVLSLLVLSQRSAPQLDKQLRQAAWDLAACIAKVPPERYEGAIHLGVVGEALARYHERTGDEGARRTLIRLYRYWASRQWSDAKGFRYRRDDAASGSIELSALALYGLAYAAWQADDARLMRRARQVSAHLVKARPTYVKSFAMLFRSSPRGLAVTSLLPER